MLRQSHSVEMKHFTAPALHAETELNLWPTVCFRNTLQCSKPVLDACKDRVMFPRCGITPSTSGGNVAPERSRPSSCCCWPPSSSGLPGAGASVRYRSVVLQQQLSHQNPTKQNKLGLVPFWKKGRFLLYIAAPPLITVDAPSHWLPL